MSHAVRRTKKDHAEVVAPRAPVNKPTGSTIGGTTGTAAAPPPSEQTLREALHAAYIDVGKGKVDRIFRRADFVTAVCGAVGTTYTGLLALVYSVGGDTANPLPARGIAPAVYLALALFFSAVNVGFVRATTAPSADRLRTAADWEEQQRRLGDFLRWIDSGAMARTWALRYAVVCLGAGVALLPLPFVDLEQGQTVLLVSAVTLASVIWVTADWWLTPPR